MNKLKHRFTIEGITYPIRITHTWVHIHDIDYYEKGAIPVNEVYPHFNYDGTHLQQSDILIKNEDELNLFLEFGKDFRKRYDDECLYIPQHEILMKNYSEEGGVWNLDDIDSSVSMNSNVVFHEDRHSKFGWIDYPTDEQFEAWKKGEQEIFILDFGFNYEELDHICCECAE